MAQSKSWIFLLKMVIFHRFLGLFTRGYHQNGAAHGGENLGQSQDFPP